MEGKTILDASIFPVGFLVRIDHRLCTAKTKGDSTVSSKVAGFNGRLDGIGKFVLLNFRNLSHRNVPVFMLAVLIKLSCVGIHRSDDICSMLTDD